MKIITLLAILILSGMLLFSTTGCNPKVTGSDNVNPLSTKKVLPVLDTLSHGSLETAFFALG